MNTSGLLVVLMLLVLIHTSIINTNIRSNEASTTLESAADYACDKMQDIYDRIDYNVSREDEYKEQLMNAFNSAMNKIIGTDGEISVTLVRADIKEETFSISIEENFQYGFQGRTGKTSCERNVHFQ